MFSFPLGTILARFKSIFRQGGFAMNDQPAVPFPRIKDAFERDPSSLCWRNPGLWLVDKPSGPSSHRAVAVMRRFLRTKRVGHAGTLDPLASGLLIVMAGNASRLFDSLQMFPKTYVAGFRLGEKTDSQDITGNPVADWRPARPPPVGRDEAEAALARFRGTVLQVPPMHSALKKDGVPLYKLARKGIEVEREPREVEVHASALRGFDGCAGELEMTVSSGFYVRTLVNDIGDALGCGAVMTSLRRTAIGPFAVAEARPLAAFQQPGEGGECFGNPD